MLLLDQRTNAMLKSGPGSRGVGFSSEKMLSSALQSNTEKSTSARKRRCAGMFAIMASTQVFTSASVGPAIVVWFSLGVRFSCMSRDRVLKEGQPWRASHWRLAAALKFGGV